MPLIFSGQLECSFRRSIIGWILLGQGIVWHHFNIAGMDEFRLVDGFFFNPCNGGDFVSIFQVNEPYALGCSAHNSHFLNGHADECTLKGNNHKVISIKYCFQGD